MLGCTTFGLAVRAVATDPFVSFDRMLQRLWSKLDVALAKLEFLRQSLLRRLNETLRFLDALKDRLLGIIKALFPYFLMLVPPVVGLVLSFFMWSPALFLMTGLLVFLLTYALLSKDKSEILVPIERINVGISTKIFGGVLLGLLLLAVLWISIGLFFGLILFFIEFCLVYFLRNEYQIAKVDPGDQT